MKKILTSTFLILTTFFVFAQEETPSQFRLGLTAHPTFAWIKSDIQGIKSNGLRAGFSYGVLGDFYFAENYAFSTALKLTTINGQTESELVANAGEQQTYKLQYIEIPLKLKLSTNESNGLKFFGEFGLGNGFNVRAKQDIKSANNSTIESDKDIYSETAFYRASLVIGAGAEFKVGEKTSIVGGLSLDNGFTDIKSGSGTLKSSYLGLNLAVFF
ncbi:porin family protein [Pedobacter cryophilus]|uniref:PorT family protein n=1 Tax=Pedobacter cryophilus TaxID=2571271 RepID=A0A4U1C4F3_9SPHI|nr:porin family protein [Pedobacter cryophilus]TKC00239.1 PorT family protein [Pedobacter cryophilus]